MSEEIHKLVGLDLLKWSDIMHDDTTIDWTNLSKSGKTLSGILKKLLANLNTKQRYYAKERQAPGWRKVGANTQVWSGARYAPDVTHYGSNRVGTPSYGTRRDMSFPAI